jgi:hypothetical protein
VWNVGYKDDTAPLDEEFDAETAAALLEVLRVRFARFQQRFGRDPEADEPLLFDPDFDLPVVTSDDECRIQATTAALAAQVDPAAVLRWLRLDS